MSFQYKTITNLIEALKKQDPKSQFSTPYSLEKINVTFSPKSETEWNQHHGPVAWDSETFNNLNITCKRTDSGSFGTVGDLLAALEKFDAKNQGKTYSITFQLQLLDGDIIATRPYFTVNYIGWEQTTLLDGHLAVREIVEHLNHLLGTSPWDHTTNGSAFEFVQAFIKNHPKVPTDLALSVYLVPNRLVDEKMCGYKVYDSLSGAKRGITSIARDKIQVGTTVVNILKSANLFVPVTEKTPNVLVFNTVLIDEIKNKITEVDKQLANLSI